MKYGLKSLSPGWCLAVIIWCTGVHAQVVCDGFDKKGITEVHVGDTYSYRGSSCPTSESDYYFNVGITVDGVRACQHPNVKDGVLYITKGTTITISTTRYFQNHTKVCESNSYYQVINNGTITNFNGTVQATFNNVGISSVLMTLMWKTKTGALGPWCDVSANRNYDYLVMPIVVLDLPAVPVINYHGPTDVCGPRLIYTTGQSCYVPVWYKDDETCSGTPIGTGSTIVIDEDGVYYVGYRHILSGIQTGCSEGQEFTFGGSGSIPDVPVVEDVYSCICDPQPVLIQPTLPNNANTLKWRDKDGELITTATSYTVDPTEYTEIYVSGFNTSTNCESDGARILIHLQSCTKCLEVFSPIAGEKYVVSAWISEDNTSEKTTFTNGNITLYFEGAAQTAGPFYAKGKIIEGWQRVEAAFTVPVGATRVKVRLNNGSSDEVAYFDDIRLFPFKANMKSFVYDPKTLRLTATLDENNYATFYRYDEEGRLNKVERETESGVKTIKEVRTANVVNPYSP